MNHVLTMPALTTNLLLVPCAKFPQALWARPQARVTDHVAEPSPPAATVPISQSTVDTAALHLTLQLPQGEHHSNRHFEESDQSSIGGR
jgi:hypothetical protein